jgi:hypothetical protein
MRPDVAEAFDRMAAAAREEAGLFLSINSAFRSDAEQARLFAANPSPHLFSALEGPVSTLRARFTRKRTSTGPAKSMRECLAADGRSLKPRACCSRGSSSQARRGRAAVSTVAA